MILIQLNPQSKIPLFKQVFLQLKEKIDQEVLKPGDRLPSSRKFSEQLGVHRTTVSKAYEELWALGYIESRQGSYSTIRKRTELATPQKESIQKTINWTEVITSKSRTLISTPNLNIQTPAEGECIDFRPLSPDPRLMPTQDFKQCVNQVLHRDGSSLLSYGDTLGYAPLREFIAQRMQQHSISVSADEILLTNGAQNAIDMVLQLLVEPGRTIAVESPSYSSALPLFRFRQAKIKEIPMKEEGMDLEALERCFKQNPPALVYTIPNFQNPTGITSNQEHREKLLALCERYRIPLIEDGFEEEMKYFGKVVLPIKSMDQKGIVLYLGTFSKVLFPGLRIGWIAADHEVIHALSEIKKTCEISGNTLKHAAMHQFCQSGRYELHIRRIHRVYRKRMETAIRTLRNHLPMENILFTKHNGGYTLWLECLQFQNSEKEIVETMLQEGVAVTAGSLFYPLPSKKKCFRISIANRNEEEIEKGIQKIGNALNKLKANAKPTQKENEFGRT
ncbi:MAG: PLP-dependent aminotransferase family protein [Marinifilaceae bacterium]